MTRSEREKKEWQDHFDECMSDPAFIQGVVDKARRMMEHPLPEPVFVDVAGNRYNSHGERIGLKEGAQNE